MAGHPDPAARPVPGTARPSRREFIARAGHWAVRTAAGVTAGGSVLAGLGCAGDPTAPSFRRFRPAPGDLALTPVTGVEADALQRLLDRAYHRAATGRGDPRVIIPYADGRPYPLTGVVRIPEGVTLEGETVAGQRPRLEASGHGQIVLARDSVCQGLHLVGPGPSSVSHRSQVSPGINSGGHVDRDTGTVLRWMEGWTLRDCRIEDFSGAGINTGIGVRNVRIERVESARNGNAGVQVGLLNEGIEILDGNYVRNGTNGIDVNGTRCRIEGNRTSRNGWNRFWDHGELLASDRNGILVYVAPFLATGGARPSGAEANVVRGNEAVQNERAGVMIVASSAGTGLEVTQRDVLVEHNRCDGNLAGVMIEGAGNSVVRDALVRHNKLVRNGNDSQGALKGWGFVAIGSRNPGTRLESNTFAGNHTAPWLFYEPDQVSVERNRVVDTWSPTDAPLPAGPAEAG